MIRPAPPPPFKTAFLTLLIAAVVALLVARGASASDTPRKAASPTPVTKLIHR